MAPGETMLPLAMWPTMASPMVKGRRPASAVVVRETVTCASRSRQSLVQLAWDLALLAARAGAHAGPCLTA